MKNKDMIQQGDVILKRVNIDISSAQKIESDNRGIILAEGEVSGHYHGVKSRNASLYYLNGKKFLEVTKKAELKHQEHNPITIEEGVWEIGQVVEKDWLSGMVNTVND